MGRLGTTGNDWGRLGTTGDDLGRLGTTGDDMGRLGTTRDALGRQRGSKEGVLGGPEAPLGSLGTHLGSFWDRLRSFCDQFGIVLKCSDHLVRFGIIWGSSGSHVFFLIFRNLVLEPKLQLYRPPWGSKPMLKLKFSTTGVDFEGFRRGFFTGYPILLLIPPPC